MSGGGGIGISTTDCYNFSAGWGRRGAGGGKPNIEVGDNFVKSAKWPMA